MPWRPLPTIANAVCTKHFEATGPDDLSLSIGDDVYITEVSGLKEQWCRGWLLAQPPVLDGLKAAGGQYLRPQAYAGIFPRDCVQVRELLEASNPPRPLTNGQAEVDGNAARSSTAGEVDGVGKNGLTNGEGRVTRGRGILRNIARNQQLALKPEDPDLSKRSDRVPGREPAPLPSLRIGDSSKVGRQEPLVEDIASCIREWHAAKLHTLSLEHDYTMLDKMSELVERLYNARRQMMHGLLTNTELAALRERTIWDLVEGNKLVDGEVIVRSPAEKGRLLTAQDSFPDMLKLQAMMSLRDRPPPAPTREPILSHLLLNIQEFPQLIDETAVLHMYLCATLKSGKTRPISEVFAVEVPAEGSLDSTQYLQAASRTLFTNLSQADIGSEGGVDSRIFLVCRLYRDEPFRRDERKSSVTGSFIAKPDADPSSSSVLASPTKAPARRFGFGSQRAPKSAASEPSPAPSPAPASTPPTPIRSGFRTAASREAASARAPTSPTPSRKAMGVQPRRPKSPPPAPEMQSPARPATAEKKLRRSAGWGVIDIGSLIRRHEQVSHHVALWTPSPSSDDVNNDQQDDREGFDDVLKTLCPSPSGHFVKAASVGQFSVRLQAFAHDDADVLIKEKPALLREIHCSRALSLNATSKVPRSDIYLTLKEATLPQHALSFHPKHGRVPVRTDTDYRNLQVTLEVRTETGQRIEHSIYPTSNRTPHTAYRTPAVDKGEAWNNTIRISLHPDDISNAHIVMSVADGPQFPFALAWVPLWNHKHGFPPDGRQTLALWDYSEYTVNIVDGKGAYQSLPPRVAELKELYNSSMATMTIETRLSSTSATQNGDVLALLNFEHGPSEATLNLLGRFAQIPDDEIAKLFAPMLGALKAILDGCADAGDEYTAPSYGNEVAQSALKCLVRVLQFLRDRRYPELDKSFEDYLQKRDFHAGSRLTLIRALRQLMSNPYDAQNGRDLRSALKVTDRILRLAVHYSGTTPTESESSTFTLVHRELQEIFEDAMIILSNTNQLALATQTIIVQSFPSWLPELAPVILPDEALGLAMVMVDACSSTQGQLRIHRLTMIHNLTILSMFQDKDLRSRIITKTTSWLRPYWPESSGTAEKALSAIRICCTIIQEQSRDMTSFQAHQYIVQLFSAYFDIKVTLRDPNMPSPLMVARTTKHNNFSPLFPSVYPFGTVSVEAGHVPNEVLLEITAVLGSFFHDGHSVNNRAEGPQTNGSFDSGGKELIRALYVLRSIQNAEAFPESWLSYTVSYSRCQLGMLEWSLDNLRESIPGINDVPDADDVLEFDEIIWTQWFTALFALVNSRTVVMEHQSDQKRRAVWTIGGDVRVEAAVMLRKAWTALGWDNDEESRKLYGLERMGGYQVQFTSELMPSIVGICLGLHADLRDAAMEVLKSMIIGEWELSGNLDVVQSAFADAFDSAFRRHGSGSSQTANFLDTLGADFSKFERTRAKPLFHAVASMLQDTGRLVGLVTAVHTSKEKEEDPATQLEQQIQLIEYLKSANNEDSYIRHVHDIAKAQEESGSYSAAALALQLHADLLRTATSRKHRSSVLSREETSMAKAYPDLELPQQTLAQRQQRLYTTMIDHYTRSHCWENVLTTLDERNKIFQMDYDSIGLARAYEESASIYRMLHTGKEFRIPRYFRVTFGSTDFPSSLAGKSFVYEGSADEDTAKFAERMKQKHPSAMVLHPGVTAPTPTIDSAHLRISNVNVNRDQLHPVNHRSGISPFFRSYQLTSQPAAFATSTRQGTPRIGILEQTVEKTIFHTKEHLPTLLGRSEIIREEKVTLTPVQAAIDRTQRKTLDIAEALQTASRAESDDDRLSRMLQSSVDPETTDGVAAYHKLTSNDDRSQRASMISSAPSKFDTEAEIEKTLLLKVLAIALEEHARVVESAISTHFDRRLQLKADLRNNFEITFAPELYAIYTSGQWRTESAAWEDPRFEDDDEDENASQANNEPTQAQMLAAIFDGGRSDTQSEAGTGNDSRRPSETNKTAGSRRSSLSLRKRLSFLSLKRPSVSSS